MSISTGGRIVVDHALGVLTGDGHRTVLRLSRSHLDSGAVTDLGWVVVVGLPPAALVAAILWPE